MIERVVIEFINMESNTIKELEVPLDISANDMIDALRQTFHLRQDLNHKDETYLIAENPIAFLHGKKTLREYGIRNGSMIIYRRKNNEIPV